MKRKTVPVRAKGRAAGVQAARRQGAQAPVLAAPAPPPAAPTQLLFPRDARSRVALAAPAAPPPPVVPAPLPFPRDARSRAALATPTAPLAVPGSTPSLSAVPLPLPPVTTMPVPAPLPPPVAEDQTGNLVAGNPSGISPVPLPIPPAPVMNAAGLPGNIGLQAGDQNVFSTALGTVYGGPTGNDMITPHLNAVPPPLPGMPTGAPGSPSAAGDGAGAQPGTDPNQERFNRFYAALGGGQPQVAPGATPTPGATPAPGATPQGTRWARGGQPSQTDIVVGEGEVRKGDWRPELLIPPEVQPYIQYAEGPTRYQAKPGTMVVPMQSQLQDETRALFRPVQGEPLARAGRDFVGATGRRYAAGGAVDYGGKSMTFGTDGTQNTSLYDVPPPQQYLAPEEVQRPAQNMQPPPVYDYTEDPERRAASMAAQQQAAQARQNAVMSAIGTAFYNPTSGTTMAPESIGYAPQLPESALPYAFQGVGRFQLPQNMNELERLDTEQQKRYDQWLKAAGRLGGVEALKSQLMRVAPGLLQGSGVYA